MKIKQISPQNSNFLQRLEFIALKPKMLYYYGILPENGAKVVAIVGARKMTAYGKEQAYRAAFELAKAGVVIVSGLATGIDSMAHRGALDAGGRTVGILGTPIDRMYPVSNQRLAEEIIEKGGAVLSECPPFEAETEVIDENQRPVAVSKEEMERWGPRVESQNGAKGLFLHRNRLISGVSDAVIIVEADLKSGSLNTAAHAFDQGKLVFAVPGDLTRQMSRGCNGLFGKGAVAYTSPEDVLDELGMKRKMKRARICGDTPAEQAVIAALKNGVNSGEEMLEWISEQGWNLDGALFNQTITMLEIKGVVKRLYQNQWMLR